MRLTPDTNILVRAAVRDDPGQSAAAQKLMNSAELIAIPMSTFCEFVWVLWHTYKRGAAEVADSISALLNSRIVETNRAAALEGIRALGSGGDFADAVTAFEGAQLGGETFATFDKTAAKLVEGSGQKVLLLK